MQSLIEKLEGISDITGRAVSWLTLFMVVLTFTIATMRYVFDIGFIWMQEAVTWMHAAVFMLGAAYALKRDQHVRVDVFYREASKSRQALINLLGVLFLLLPLCGFFLWSNWEYVLASWSDREGSRQAQGLGFPATPILKSFLLAMPVLVLLQAGAIGMKSVRTLRGHDAN